MSATTAATVLGALLVLALFIATRMADEVHRLRQAPTRSPYESITLDIAVAVVIDTLATGDDDAVDYVSIERDQDGPGAYVVVADVVHDDGSLSYAKRTVFVPDDLDAPIGVRPALPPVVGLAPGIDVTDAVQGGA